MLLEMKEWNVGKPRKLETQILVGESFDSNQEDDKGREIVDK